MAGAKIGIFWSGSLGRQAAQLHEELLRGVFPDSSIFISTKIDVGAVWLSTLRDEISTTRVGVFLLTPDSLESSWRPFEVGFLAADDRRAVIPVRVGTTQSLVDARAPYLQSHHAAVFGTLDSFESLCLACARHIEDGRSLVQIGTAAQEAWSKLQDRIVALKQAVAGALPNPYEGIVRCARSINQSNFNMPAVFSLFEKEFFLVGINHAFILDVKNDPTVFAALARRLLEPGANRRARFLISDMWNPSVFDCYQALVHAPVAQRERDAFTEIFKTPGSAANIEAVLARELGGDAVDRLVKERLLEIRVYPTILDTFWLIDGRTGHGKLQLSPANAAGGPDRPFFFSGEDPEGQNQPPIFTYYYNLADTAYSVATRLWPA